MPYKYGVGVLEIEGGPDTTVTVGYTEMRWGSEVKNSMTLLDSLGIVVLQTSRYLYCVEIRSHITK